MLQQPLAHFPRASSLWMLHLWLISWDMHTKKLNELIFWALHGALCPYFKQDRVCTALHITVKHPVHHFPAGFILFTNWIISRFRKQDPTPYNTLFFHFPSLLAVSFCADLPCNYKHSSAKKTFLSVPFLSMLFLPPVSSEIYFCSSLLTSLTEQSILASATSPQGQNLKSWFVQDNWRAFVCW